MYENKFGAPSESNEYLWNEFYKNYQLKRDHDTILDIDESSFINIVEKCINLPSREIILGTNPTNPLLPCAGVNLEINIIGQKIEYNIYSPSEDTKERGLEEFYEVCRDIIELSGMKAKKFL